MSSSLETIKQIADHTDTSFATMFEYGIGLVEEAYDGIDIVDATNPAVTILGTCASITAGGIARTEKLSRREYPVLAQTLEDLYPHLSYQDHLDRFAKPCDDTEIFLAYATNDLRNKAIYDAVTGIGKLTIPKDSQFEVNGISFYLGYPIDIIISADGQVQANWNDTEVNPIRSLSSNHIPTRHGYFKDGEVSIFTIPMIQLKAQSYSYPISTANGLNEIISFSDNFYAVRVYFSTGTTRQEITVTFDQQVYSASEYTAVVKVLDNAMELRIPEIYISNGMAGTIEMEVFTTKGDISVDLKDFGAEAWDGDYSDFSDDSNRYINSFLEITTRSIDSLATTSGGASALSFSALRDRAVYGKYGKDASVTFKELKQTAIKEGFGIDRQRDTLVERTYVATRKLDTITAGTLSSGSGSASTDVLIDLSRSDILSHVIRQDGLNTVKPIALYRREIDEIVLVSDQERLSFEGLSVFEKSDSLNNAEYFYTPFHYVIDENVVKNNLRAYYLAAPGIANVNLRAENYSLGFTISTSAMNLSYDEETQTYQLVVVANTPNLGDDVAAVLNRTDPSTGEKWDIVGTLEPIDSTTSRFIFTFGNALDLDKDDKFTVTGMTDDTSKPRMELAEDFFDLVYVVTDSANPSILDEKMARRNADFDFTAIAHEEVYINFGVNLDGLYRRIRKVSVAPVYETYKQDVPLLREATKYVFEAGGRVTKINDDGSIEFITEYNEGDPVLVNDEVVYANRIGDYVKTAADELIEIKPFGFGYIMRMCLVDAKFRYANTSSIVKYRDSIPTAIINALKGPIARLNSGLIDETDLYFEPASDKNTSLATLEAGREANIQTSLSFKIAVRLNESAYRNTSIRSRIRQGIVSTILDELENREFYLSRLYRRLDLVSPDNIKAIEIQNPLSTGSIATLKDENASFTLASKALVLSNGQLDIVDDIDFEWTT